MIFPVIEQNNDLKFQFEPKYKSNKLNILDSYNKLH